MKKIIKTSLAALLVIASLTACNSSKSDVDYSEAGTYEKEETLKTATISTDGVILSNKVIEGDLNIILNEGNTVTLQNVTVNGSINIMNEALSWLDGLFTSVNAASDYLTLNMFDSTCNEVNVKKVNSYIVASGSTNINVVNSDSNLRLVEQSITKNGFNDVVIKGNKDLIVTLLGAGIRSMDVESSGVTTIITDSSTLIEMLTANSETTIEGQSKINVLVANAVVTATDAEIGNTVIGNNGAVNGEVEKPEVTTSTSASSAETSKVTTKSSSKVTTTSKKPTTTVTTTTTTKPVTTTTTTTTTTKANTAPVITADDVTVLLDNSFNPLKGVTIYDAEDGYITVTSKNIKSNTVNTSKTGTYYVTYTYTDKGGLTTTHQRKVVVTRTIDAPTNLTAQLDKYGDLEIAWDAVDNAYNYEVYIGSKSDDYMIYVPRSKTSVTVGLVTKEEDEDLEKEEYFIDRSTTIYVCAVPKDEDLNASAFAKYTYTPQKEIDTVPTRLTQSSSRQSFELRIPAEGISTSAEGSVVAHYEDEDGNMTPLKNTKIGTGVTTNSSGVAEFDYDRDNGIEFDMLFDKAGIYSLTVRIKDDDVTVFNEIYEIEVRKSSSGSSSSTSSYTKPTITDYVVGSKFAQGATVYFTLNKDLDLSDKDANLRIYVDYYTDSFDEDIVTKATSYACSFTGETLYASDKGSDPAHIQDNGDGTYTYTCDYDEHEGSILYTTKYITDDKYIYAGDEYSFDFNLTQSKVSEVYEYLSAGYKVTFTITIEVTDEDGDVRTATTAKKSYQFN